MRLLVAALAGSAQYRYTAFPRNLERCWLSITLRGCLRHLVKRALQHIKQSVQLRSISRFLQLFDCIVCMIVA